MKKNKRMIETKPYILWELLERLLPYNLLFSFYPPYLGSGIKITHISSDFKFIRVELSLNFFNTNYVGTHFGGSLFSMTDPFYMLMFLKNMGKEYIVWDKKATIEFIKATQEDVYAEFKITNEEIELIKQELNSKKSLEKNFFVEIKTKSNREIIAKVEKTLYFRKMRNPLS